MTGPWSLYTAPSGRITPELLHDFLVAQQSLDRFRESLTLELKEKRHKDNVVRAIAGFSNTDGGLVLLGIDERAPTFEASPGVPATSDMVAVADQCRQVLAPTTIPEMIEVPLPSGRVIVVIRVDPAAGGDAPVVLGGTVYVRAPGQTVPATRDQILALVNRDGTASSVASLPSAWAIFGSHEGGGTVGTEVADLHIRVRGAAWLRRTTALSFRFSSRIRETLKAAFEDSSPATVLYASAFENRHGYGPQSTVLEQSSHIFSLECDFNHREAHNQLRVSFHFDGQRISWFASIKLRIQEVSLLTPQLVTAEAPHVSGPGLAISILTLLELASVGLPAALELGTEDALLHIDPPVGSIASHDRDLASVIRPGRATRHVQNSQVHIRLDSTSPPTDYDASRDLASDWLSRIYLDLGYEQEDLLAQEDVAFAVQQRQTAMSWVSARRRN
jgi:Putative DNA-binding domain